MNMEQKGRSRTLRVYTVLWVVLPLMVVMATLLTAGGFAFERILIHLLVDRHAQIAATAAVGVSEVIEGYAHILEALASNPGILDPIPERPTAVLQSASDALEVFNAGVTILDTHGREVAFAASGSGQFQVKDTQMETFRLARDVKEVVFSEIVFDPLSADHYILVSVPILDQQGGFRGAIIGMVRPRTAALSKPIKRLTVGKDGYAYLVDSSGKVIFHPAEDQIGKDYSSQAFFQQVMADRNSGTLWRSSTGKRLFEADAPVAATGWTLIVQESWESAVAPALPYRLAAISLGSLAVLIVGFVSWQGMRRISQPIQLLCEQTKHISSWEPLDVIKDSGIKEIDELEKAFTEMARQVNTYRAGLRRYIEALTQSQENERKRIARELHDETVQNILAISRQLELYQDSESEPVKLNRLKELQALIGKTLEGIRQISRDLRPLMLEDLGLIPALQNLVSALRQGEGALPHAQLEVHGEPGSLTPEQELAIYRITQEALNNVRKHARAARVLVKVVFESERVILDIADDGTGFEPPESLALLTQRGRFGLLGIQERVWAMEGSLSIGSSPNQGTEISITIPLSRPVGSQLMDFTPN